MYARLLISLALGTALSVSAQTTNPPASARSLTLRECIDLALSKNLDLQIVHLNADIARFNLSGANGPYMPVLALNARHDFVSQPADFDPQKFNLDFPYELNADTVGPTLKGKLPMGLSYDFTAYVREDNATTDFRGNPEDANNFPGGIRTTNNYYAEARVTLEQHLLRDFWIDADRERLLLRRKDLKISQQAVRFQVMKTILAVELSYYDLATVLEDLRVEEGALRLREQFLEETRRRVQVGDLSPLDAEQAATQVQNTLTALSAAREAMGTEENRLKALLTDDFRSWVSTDLRPQDPLTVFETTINRSKSFENALRNRPDLLEARLAVEKGAVTVRFRKNQLLPNLDVVGRYGGLGVDPDYGTAINNVFSFRDPEYFYGVVLSFPLSNVGERANYNASKAARQIAELQLKKAEQDVLVEIADLVNRVQTRYAQVGSTQKARAYAESALAAEEKKLASGLSTTFVVLQLQETLIAARTAEVRAKAQYNRALAQLAFAEGGTLERHRLDLEVK